jgi:hypothetical protein
MMGPGAAPPVLVGGALSADGPIMLPSFQKGAPLTQQTLMRAYYAQPQMQRAPAAVPYRVAPAGFQQTANVVPGPTALSPLFASPPVNREPIRVELPPLPPAPPGAGEGPAAAGSCGDCCAVVPAECIADAQYPPPDGRYGTGLPEGEPLGYHLYGSLEYLFWFTERGHIPQLLDIGVPPTTANPVGDTGQRQGGRFTTGIWLNPCNSCGLEASFFFMGQRNQSRTASSDGTTTLAVPFTDATTGMASSVPLAMLGTSTASSTIEMFHQLWGAETNGRWELVRNCWGHLDLLTGVRYLESNEHLAMNDFVNFITAPIVLSDAKIHILDSFATENRFIGGQLGLETEFHIDRFFFDVWGKCALGDGWQRVQITGATTVTAPPQPIGSFTAPGGIFAQPSNIGGYARNQFMVIPEFGVRAGVRVTDNLRFSVGYDFLYITNLLRPANQIDTIVNPNQIPFLFPMAAGGASRPAFQFRDEDFWAHGVNLELEYRY